MQIFAPAKKYSGRPIIKLVPFARVYADTFFIDDKAVVTFVDTFSKFGWAVAFKAPINSEKASRALESFYEQIKKRGYSKDDVVEIRTDGGSEFSSFGNTHTRTMPYAKQETGLIERFNGTIRRILMRISEVRVKPINWITKYLPIALKAYNNIQHRTTKEAPEDILNDKATREKAVKNLRSKAYKAAVKAEKQDVIKQGDSVRIYIRNPLDPFDTKISPNWSTDVYKVKEVDNKTRRLKVNDDWYKPEYLLKINPDLLMGKKETVKQVVKEKPRVEQVENEIVNSVKERRDRKKKSFGDDFV